ncbi:MAG TPA: MaoC/PaaZ C-terminal domain-containing protein [Dehalococcoidia bacterium]|nr:MaoC/PaaZ C-terminal domain-containing protein [Dehalococcoidia bacterium]
MAKLTFEDVQVGAEIPSYTRKCTLMELNRFAGANEEFVPIHMDRDYSKNVAGLPDAIVMGYLKFAYLGSMLTNWIGEDGDIRKISVSYRAMDPVDYTLTARGKVTGKQQKDGQGLIECEVWVENQEGIRTTPGTAVVALPRKG